MSNDVNAQASPPADSGRAFAITGLVFAFLIPIVGLILGLVARNRAHATGSQSRLPTVTIVVSAILLVLELLAGVLVTVSVFSSSR